MPLRRTRSTVAGFAAAVVGLATLALATPALGQAEPGASSTTTVDATSTTAVDASSTTTEDPASTTTTEATGTTEAPPPPTATDTPFPASLVAPVPPVEGAPDTAITDLYVTDGATPEEPDVVVQFREPFTFAGTPYRVGVVIGDPNGTRLRTWLISNGPENLPYGRVERFEAGSWAELGATPVRFENGLMVITVPITEAPAGGAVWAEIVENDASTPSHTTPYFSRDALFGAADAGTVPSAVFGRVFGLDGISAEPVELPTGGTLVAVGDQIAVDYPDPPPSEVDGQEVTTAVDIVRIAPDYDGGAIIANFVRLDRTTGEVGLYDGFSPVPIDKSGDRSWLVAAPAPREAGALILDRAAIVTALGLPDDGAGIALGVSRELALEDGRLVTAEGVLATDAWLDLAPASALPEVTTTTVAAGGETQQVDETRQDRLPLLIGAGVGIVVLLLLVVLLRRRSNRRAEIEHVAAAGGDGPKQDRMPWGSTDGDLIITTTHEFDALIPADATPLPGPAPVDPSPVPTAPAGSGVRILADPVGGAPAPEPAPPIPPAVVEPSPVEPAVPEPSAAEPSAPSALDREPAWGTAAVAGTVASSGDATGEPSSEVGPAVDADDEDEPDEPRPLDPGRVDPMAALSALDEDMAELRRRVASLGDS